MECMICFQDLTASANWGSFFTKVEEKRLCEDCFVKLDKLSGTRCMLCSRRTTEKICLDCKRWQKEGKADLTFNYSIFAYNNFMKEVVAKWKYRGDYQIAEAFAADFRHAFKKKFSFIKNPIVIPIPLSEERIKERAFNQAKQLADFLPARTIELLARKHGDKQSKKSKEERMNTENPFLVKGPIQKPAIVVDDIYTTGRTMYHAAERLKQQGCPAVYGLTLIRG